MEPKPIVYDDFYWQMVENGKAFNDEENLKKAVEYLEDNLVVLRSLNGQKSNAKNKEIIDEFIKGLLAFESAAKSKKANWRFVVDFGVGADGSFNPPTIQFCSGAPSYNRYVVSVEPGSQVKARLVTDCVESSPDLSKVRGGEGTLRSPTLEQTKQFYDKAGVQRVAILGAARVFPYNLRMEELQRSKILKEIDHEGEVELARLMDEEARGGPEKLKWPREYTEHAQRELNGFLDYMASQGTPYTTVNGGWAGMKEGSMGMPMISSLIGAVHSSEEGNFYPPITVMPQGGSYDRVQTMADRVRGTSAAEDHATATYFEVPGVWGDDSKYLAGLSTSLLVFEPYGFWTNIEIANGVAQDKPVAIIADPKKLNEPHNWSQDGKYYTSEIDLPGNKKGEVRVYKHAEDAAEWMNQEFQKKYVIENRHSSSAAQEQYDRSFGIVLKG